MYNQGGKVSVTAVNTWEWHDYPISYSVKPFQVFAQFDSSSSIGAVIGIALAGGSTTGFNLSCNKTGGGAYWVGFGI